MEYICTDGHGADITIEAGSAEEAAQEYVDGGDWGTVDRTTWVGVGTTPLDADSEEIDGGSETIRITIDPEEPDCSDGEEHEWESPYCVLGGLRDNPGARGHGGGVIITVVCRHCAKYRVTDTWSQNPDGGEQGLRSTEYRDADDESEAWANAQAVDTDSN